MYSYKKAALKRNFLIALSVLAAILIVCAGIAALVLIKPALIDKNEVSGTPDGIPEKNAYTSYEAEGVCGVALSCLPDFDGKYADLYLTNPQDSEVLIKAELYTVKEVVNSDGGVSYVPDKLIGESGFIHPGTYVKSVKVKGVKTGSQTKVMVKIATMVESTEKSNGIFYIRTTIS